MANALAPAAPAAAALGTVVYLAGEFGGYFPPTWGWSAVVLLAVAAGTLLLRPILPLKRLDWALLAGLAALAGWTGLSWVWSGTPPESILEFQRAVLYLAGAGALLLLARRSSLAWTVGALLGAAVGYSCYALATRFFPADVPAVYSTWAGRLGGSFAYANALGIFTAMGAGADLFHLRDATRDQALCVTEADTVEADLLDIAAADCETVARV